MNIGDRRSLYIVDVEYLLIDIIETQGIVPGTKNIANRKRKKKTVFQEDGGHLVLVKLDVNINNAHGVVMVQ